MKKVLLSLVTVGTLFVLAAGCDKKDEKKPEGAAASGDKIGVQECDDYITKYAACIEKMPAAAKAPAEQGFKAQKDAWKSAASTPAGKDGLKAGCKIALDSVAANPACK